MNKNSSLNSVQSNINPILEKSGNIDDNSDEILIQNPALNPNTNLNETDNFKKIPKIDSGILFQSNIINNEEANLAQSIKYIPSTQIPPLSISNDGDFLSNNGSIEDFNTILKSSKIGNFPPEININNYFYNLYQKEINITEPKSKEELISYMEPYSIENYARNHFRKQKGVVIFNSQTINKITTFSMKPLTKPLLEKTPINKKESTERLNIYILLFIDVLFDKKQEEIYKGKRDEYKNTIILIIVKLLRDDEFLIDEFFMQMIKLMRNSPNHETLLLSWKLFLIFTTLFYVKDEKISNVIRWFLIQNIFGKDIFSDYAQFTFICFHERNVLEKNFDVRHYPSVEILKIPTNVYNGEKMFKCSLYMQMWNQRRKYPKLPIPLTLYLVYKTLIKNGVMITSNPFPNLGKKLPKTMKKQKFDDNNDFELEENYIDNDEDNNENDSNNNRYCYRKADMKIVKFWISNLNDDYNIINDGEVCNLLALMLTWIMDLLDPIVPKSMANSFIEIFKNCNDPSYNEKCKEFVENLPLLHKNTLKFIVGFLREIAKNEKLTHETHHTMADNLGLYFIQTSFITIDPFTRKEMHDISPSFLLYCLDNLDVVEVYPLNPEYEVCVIELDDENITIIEP